MLIAPRLSVALVCLTSLIIAPVSRATTITVNEITDEVNGDGDCSLREAIRAANLNETVDACSAGMSGLGDVILLTAGTYTLTRVGAGEDLNNTGDLDITENVLILGPSRATTFITAGSGWDDRLVHVTATGELNLQAVTLSGGNVTGEGGCIHNQNGLNLASCIIRDCRATLRGGAVSSLNGVSMSGALVERNTSSAGNGGGLALSGGNVTIRESTIRGNTSGGDGGGLTHGATQMTADGVTISDNEAGNGGGIHGDGNSSFINCTISGNRARVSGGGIFGSGDLFNVTVTANRADSDANGSGIGGGVNTNAQVLGLLNSIVAANTNGAAPDIAGEILSSGHNLIGSSTGITSSLHPTDLVGSDPLLTPLQDNGGATLTHGLLIGSPALDAGNPALPNGELSACQPIDQREIDRPVGPRCDIGAFEGTATSTTTTSTTTTSTTTTTTSPSCGSDPSFTAVRCSLGLLRASVTTLVPPGALQNALTGTVTATDNLLQRAEAADKAAGRRRVLGKARKRLKSFQQRLRSKAARGLDPDTRSELAATAESIRAGIRSLF